MKIITYNTDPFYKTQAIYKVRTAPGNEDTEFQIFEMTYKDDRELQHYIDLCQQMVMGSKEIGEIRSILVISVGQSSYEEQVTQIMDKLPNSLPTIFLCNKATIKATGLRRKLTQIKEIEQQSLDGIVDSVISQYKVFLSVSARQYLRKRMNLNPQVTYDKFITLSVIYREGQIPDNVIERELNDNSDTLQPMTVLGAPPKKLSKVFTKDNYRNYEARLRTFLFRCAVIKEDGLKTQTEVVRRLKVSPEQALDIMEYTKNNTQAQIDKRFVFYSADRSLSETLTEIALGRV